ncbi:hypothetical protein BDV93DRAFT_560259, partial [Ceratobasidium sp. AG-I]
ESVIPGSHVTARVWLWLYMARSRAMFDLQLNLYPPPSLPVLSCPRAAPSLALRAPLSLIISVLASIAYMTLYLLRPVAP